MLLIYLYILFLSSLIRVSTFVIFSNALYMILCFNSIDSFLNIFEFKKYLSWKDSWLSIIQMKKLCQIRSSFISLRFRQTEKLRYKKWRFFINASNIHSQISLILLNVVSFHNLCNIVNVKIDICTVLCQKIEHRLTYTL